MNEIEETSVVPVMAAGDNPVCFQSHMGIYAMEKRSLEQAVAEIIAFRREEGAAESGPSVIQVVDGTAIVHISDAIMKKPSKFGGTSTQVTRMTLRNLARNPQVEKIALVIDSPGGSVKGVDDLASTVRDIAAEKPVIAYCEDMACSAAYWIASQATEVVANRSALVGSLGAFSVVYDTSEKASREGVKVHVVSSGGVKGAGQPGTPFTDEQRAALQGVIDTHTSIFKASVQHGRGLSDEQIEALFDGRVFGAEEALALGLIDRIGTLDSIVHPVKEEATMADESGTVSVEELTSGIPGASAIAREAGKAVAGEFPPKKEDEEEGEKDEKEGDEKKKEEEASTPAEATPVAVASTPVDTMAADVAELTSILVSGGCPINAAGIAASLRQPSRKEMYAEFARLSRIPSADAGASISGFEAEQPKAATEADPVALFESAVADAKAAGKPAAEAVLSVIKKNPELHRAYLAASQSK